MQTNVINANQKVFNNFTKPMSNCEHEIFIKVSNSEIPSFDVKFNKDTVTKISSRLYKSFSKPMTNTEYEAKFNY